MDILCGEKAEFSAQPVESFRAAHEFMTSLPESFGGLEPQLAKLGTYEAIEVISPFNNLFKQDIAKIGSQIGIEYEKTWSCYKGEDIHCGKCGTCVERKEAFALAGIEDKTAYKS